MKKSLGRISKTLLVFGGMIIVVIILVLGMVNRTRKAALPEEPEPEPEPVYEIVIGDIKFKLHEVKDRGNILKFSESKYPERQRPDLTTTERFIEVTVAVENIGKDNIKKDYWDIKELVDSEERKFYSLPEAEPWIPAESKCGAILKPGFSPTLCTKIYEVAKISSGLKVGVYSREKKKQTFFIDLGI